MQTVQAQLLTKSKKMVSRGCQQIKNTDVPVSNFNNQKLLQLKLLIITEINKKIITIQLLFKNCRITAYLKY